MTHTPSPSRRRAAAGRWPPLAAAWPRRLRAPAPQAAAPPASCASASRRAPSTWCIAQAAGRCWRSACPTPRCSGSSFPPGRSCWRRWRSAAGVRRSPAIRRRCSRRPPARTCSTSAPSRPSRDSSAILVQPDSPLKTLADLKGRRVALQKGSSAHYLLVRALEKAGLQWADIRRSTCRRPMRAPRSSAARSMPGRSGTRSTPPTELDDQAARAGHRPRPVGQQLVLPGLARPSPRSIRSRAARAVRRADRAPTPTCRRTARRRRSCIADFSGLSLATVHLFLSRRPPSPVGPLTPALVADQQQVADAFAQLGPDPASRCASPTSSGSPARRSRWHADRPSKDA